MDKDVKYIIGLFTYGFMSAIISVSLLRYFTNKNELKYISLFGKILGLTSILAVIIVVLIVVYKISKQDR